MTRVQDWQSRLQAVIAEYSDRSFVDGVSDCAMFSADAVLAMTGRDVAAGFRGYDTQAEGLDRLQSEGFRSHVDFVAAHFHESQSPRAGDLAVLTFGSEEATGVVQGRGVYMMGPRGLVLFPRSWIERSFEV